MSSSADYCLDVVALHITQRCAHSCPFCYAASNADAPHPEYDQIARIVRAIGTAHPRDLVLLGGDPGSYPRILDLAELAHSLGMTTTVLSNTHSYVLEDASRAVEAVDCIEATFHGATADAHDSVSGVQGSFDSLIRTLGVAAHAGARSIGVVFNVTADSPGRLYSTVRRVSDLVPIDHLVLQRIIPQGRGKATTDCVMTPSAVSAALAEVERINDELGVSVICEDAFPLCSVPRKYHHLINRCEWGFTRASVGQDGSLTRCGAETDNSLGNVLETPLLEIWRSHPALTEFRERRYLPEECRSCDLVDKCGGGCSLACEVSSGCTADYLMRKAPANTGGMVVREAGENDLAGILRIEWAAFADYPFGFTAESLQRWFVHNPEMFRVLVDESDTVRGYLAIAPLAASGCDKLRSGAACSIDQLEEQDVLRVSEVRDSRDPLHVEVIAVTGGTPTSQSLKLISWLASRVSRAPVVTATPATTEGRRLAIALGLRPIATHATASGAYEIFESRRNGDA